MQLTTQYREERRGILTGEKDTVVVCTVAFSHEERAIIRERGLYTYHISLEHKLPPLMPGAAFFQIGGIILAILGIIVILCATYVQGGTLGAQITGWIMLLAGGGLGGFVTFQNWRFDNVAKDPERCISLGDLLVQPTFFVREPAMLLAQQTEENIREQLSSLAAVIRESAAAPEEATRQLRNRRTYDL